MEFVASLFPSTAGGWVIQIVGSIIASYVLISFGEYMFHRYLMHQGLPEGVYRLLPFLRPMLYEHRALHHGKYYKQFNYEPDPYGKEVNLHLGVKHTLMAGLLYVPYFVLTIIFVSLIPTIVACLIAALHNIGWNVVHPEMHNPQGRSFAKWRMFQFLARNHFLHHKHTRTNFNIVFPFMD